MKEGDKLKCIKTDPFPANEVAPSLEIEAEYKAKEVFICSCGQEHVNVGLPMNVNYVECYKCREKLPPTNHWCNSSRFEVVE